MFYGFFSVLIIYHSPRKHYLGCCFAPPSGRNLQDDFSRIFPRFQSVLVNFSQFFLRLHSALVNFSQFQSVLVNFSQL